MLFQAIPLLSRLQRETQEVMVGAAELRLFDSETLLANGRWDGAIYSAGYVAEMLLKVAFCRIPPVLPASDEVRNIFAPAAALWNTIAPPGTTFPPQRNHSLIFWETILDAKRRNAGLGAIHFESRLPISKSISAIRQHWQVELRYQRGIAVESEASEVCIAARYLFDNRGELWRR